MTKFISLLLIASISICTAYAQQVYITSSLHEAISNEKGNEDALFRINIVLRDQLDNETLKKEFNANKTPSKERAKIIQRKAIQLAKESQSRLLSELNHYKGRYDHLVSYWLVNMIVLDASPELIRELTKSKEIDIIDLDDSHLVLPVKPVKVVEGEAKSVGGTEPGLRVINAPKLWAMGYTGKGRISFTLDTGVWPNHPSFGGRFLGNYFPLERSWLGFDNPLPYDKGNSHGTHVTGTTLGLDLATSDTIGVAFNAYFMASDPVATSLATVKPLTSFVTAFEWALNPDGDTATTDDIPDVINNSWGYSVPTDTLLCTSFASQMLQTIEAAGIANVFSAGNEGPGDSTISSPHHIVTGLVNSFTVGSISPHDTTYPISSFSSRGPSICPASGSLAIKPEIVAPGFQIRSSVDQSSYATYNGTSMASPHVTGAVLLLKEAFPYLTGEEILLALYYSAKDLGITGEDNTYGKGIIDVYAAFQYLALTHTPVPPKSNDYDVCIDKVIAPNKEFTCDTIITPQIQIKNKGINPILMADIYYWIDENNKQHYPWVGSILTGQTANIMLPNISSPTAGPVELRFQILLDTSITESDDINNFSIARFNVRGTAQLPYFEDFEFTSLPENGWYVGNEDQEIGWETDSTGGLYGIYSAKMNHFKYYPRSNQKDDLLSPIIEFPNSGKFTLLFDRAYMLKHKLFADTLRVFLISNCDLNQKTLVYEKGGEDLKTFDSSSTDFTPWHASQWDTDTIDLSNFVGQGEFMIDFQTTNRYGNNLYLDNMRIFSGNTPPTSIEEVSNSLVSIFPNPANSWVNLTFEDDKSTHIRIGLYDIYGTLLFQKEFTSTQKGQLKIPLLDYADGLYIILYQTNQGTKSHKIIKQ